MQALDGAGIRVISGMMAMAGEDYSTLESIRKTGGVRPDGTWDDNAAAARANARLARRLGIGLVTFHAGFIPERAGAARREMLRRLRTLADIFDDCGVRVGLETGQERAETLIEVLEELEAMGGAQVGVNFDPANMILYGMGDPVQALEALAPRVVQVHIKDAVATRKSGTWGKEVPAGDGDVDWSGFFRVFKVQGLNCDCVIEREAGEKRAADIAAAAKIVAGHLAARPRTSKRSASSSGSRRGGRR